MRYFAYIQHRCSILNWTKTFQNKWENATHYPFLCVRVMSLRDSQELRGESVSHVPSQFVHVMVCFCFHFNLQCLGFGFVSALAVHAGRHCFQSNLNIRLRHTFEVLYMEGVILIVYVYVGGIHK